MTNSPTFDIIDIELYSNLVDIVEKCYIYGKNFYIEFKKPKKDKIIATIKNDYTAFRKEIEKLLKEKDISKDDLVKILHMVDNSNEIIFKDINSNITNTTKIDSNINSRSLA